MAPSGPISSYASRFGAHEWLMLRRVAINGCIDDRAVRQSEHVGEPGRPGPAADLASRVALAFVHSDLITLVEIFGGKGTLSVDAARSNRNHGPGGRVRPQSF